MSDIDSAPNVDPVPSDLDALVTRLRKLEWPEVRTEVAERCWEQFSRRLDSGEDEAADAARSDRNAGRRLDFTRRTVALPRRFASSPYARTPALVGRAGVRTPALTR